MDEPRTELTEAECWELLRSQELGRLAWADDDHATILPVNYAVDGDGLVFRTAPGSKLEAVFRDRPLAFEVDRVDGETGLSVLIRGRGHLLTADDEGRVEQDGLRAWLGGDKPILIRLAPSEMSGRRYALQRPWKRMMR